MWMDLHSSSLPFLEKKRYNFGGGLGREKEWHFVPPPLHFTLLVSGVKKERNLDHLSFVDMMAFDTHTSLFQDLHVGAHLSTS